MKATSDIPETTEYGAESLYISPPTNAQWLAGVAPQRTLPAAWWNYFTNLFTNTAVGSRDDINSVLAELNNVLAAGGITPDPALNNQLLTVLNNNVADLVIDSDAKLLQWQTSGTYERVHIRKGTWTLPTGGINLTARGTKQVTGEAGSLIVCSAGEQENAGLYYTELPGPSQSIFDRRMDGVNVEVHSAWSSDYVHCFRGCVNMSNCFGRVNPAAANEAAWVYTDCTRLRNCSGEIIFAADASWDAGVFVSCFDLSQCYGTVDTTGGIEGSGMACIFSSCVGVTQCMGTLLGSFVSQRTFRSSFKLQQNRGTYSTCYATEGTNPTYLCADTPNGGFNSNAWLF